MISNSDYQCFCCDVVTHQFFDGRTKKTFIWLKMHMNQTACGWDCVRLCIWLWLHVSNSVFVLWCCDPSVFWWMNQKNLYMAENAYEPNCMWLRLCETVHMALTAFVAHWQHHWYLEFVDFIFYWWPLLCWHYFLVIMKVVDSTWDS